MVGSVRFRAARPPIFLEGELYVKEQQTSKPDEQSFDRFADNYSETLGEAVAVSGESAEYFTQLKIEIMRAMLGAARIKPGMRFLDYGCGTGRAFDWIDKTFPSPEYVGVDPSPESIRYAREHIRDSRASFALLEEMNKQSTPLFSCALSSVVFHHIPVAERHAAATSIYEKLQPGGAFFIFEHNPLNPLTRHIVNNCPFDDDAVLLRAGECSRLLKSAGFTRVQIRYYFFFPRFIGFLRPLEKLLGWNPAGAQYAAVGWKP